MHTQSRTSWIAPLACGRRALAALVCAGLVTACRKAPEPEPDSLSARSGALAPAPLQPSTQAPPSTSPSIPQREPSRPSETSGPKVAFVQEEGAIFRVDGVAADDVLNVRSAPDPAASLAGTIPPTAQAVIGIGTPTTIGQTTWQRVRYAGVEGWVNKRFLKAPAAPPAASSSGSAPAAPTSAAATPPSNSLQSFVCFGDEPFWSIEFGADGSATCGEACKGPPGLRSANVSTAPNGDLQGFDLVDAKGGVFVSAVTRKTGTCSDGMSDDPYPYVFSGVGKPGPLAGCCRVKRPGEGSGG